MDDTHLRHNDAPLPHASTVRSAPSEPSSSSTPLAMSGPSIPVASSIPAAPPTILEPSTDFPPATHPIPTTTPPHIHQQTSYLATSPFERSISPAFTVLDNPSVPRSPHTGFSTEARHPTYRPPLLRPAPSRVSGHPGRLLSGVCAGIALHLQLSVVLVRLLFLAFFPAGFLIYVAVTLSIPSGDPRQAYAQTRRQESGRLSRSLNERSFDNNHSHKPDREASGLPLSNMTSLPFHHQAILGALALVGLSALVVLSAGYEVISPMVLFAVIILIGLALAWSHADQLIDTPRRSALIIAVGMLITGIGIILAVTSMLSPSLLRPVIAGLAAMIAVGLAVFPMVSQLTQQLSQARVTKARESERADIAAHLHDSVLQTLALIRKRADDADFVEQASRQQERELRNWLYGRDTHAEHLLSSLVKNTIAKVEDHGHTSIELVTVGDCPADKTVYGLDAIICEASTNAVRHAKPPISVYVEVMPDILQAFIRDRGSGFDIDAIPDDRHGVRDSIIGRAKRLGGNATIKSTESGTEVSVTLPRNATLP
ncbi:MAG: PspC domain-containing protein [Actinomycetaceae bacterium]|nr:PspC domain-containing protein [Actinomycetaceae bacterium]